MSKTQAHAPRTEAKKYKRDIIEVHVDSCAQMGSSSIHAVQALGNLYRAVGHKKLVYIETEQGLREKTDRTNYAMWQTLGSPNTIYNNFLELNGGMLEVHATQFCKGFERDFSKHIYPTMVEPVLTIMDDMDQKVREKAFAIIQKNDPEKLKEYGIKSPADIAFEFYDKAIEKHGETRVRTRVRGLQITIKAKGKDETRDAVWMAVKEVCQHGWQPLISEKSKHNGGLFSKKNAELDSFVEMLYQHQQLGAVTAQLAFALEPQHMKDAGYQESPIAHLGDKQFDPQVIKKHVHLFPAFSLLKPPLSDLPAESHQPIVMQALRLSGFWPWSRQAHMEPKHCDRLKKTHRNRADHAILDYFMSVLPEKSDADRRALVVVTHDGPLIQEFAEFATGFKHSQQNGRDQYGRKTQGKLDIVKPLAPHDYEFDQPDAPIIRLPVRDPKDLPPHAALTGQEFVKFVAHELNEVKGRYDSEHRPPQAIREAIADVEIALKHLKAAAARDRLPDSLVREATMLERIERGKPNEVSHTDIGGGILSVQSGVGASR